MPDWTYQPLRGIAAALLGEKRSQRAALRVLATIGSLDGGRLVARAFGNGHPPPHLAGTVAGVPVTSRLGAVVPPAVARDALCALPPLGAGLIEIGPVGVDDVDLVRAAVVGRRVPVLINAAGTDAPTVVTRLASHVDAVRVGADPAVRYQSSPSIADAVRTLTGPAAAVLVTPAVLIHSGPGWFARVIEAATPTTKPPRLSALDPNPRRWPAWCWALLVGLGLLCTGLIAVAITLGPVLLWYDKAFLGAGTDDLNAINPRLIGFLQHDRISMAGVLMAIGVLYAGLAAGGIRRGWPWARETFLISGWIGFPTLLYFFGTGFVEPLHTASAATLFPMFLLVARRRPHVRPQWTVQLEGPEDLRRKALIGQLLLVLTGVGLTVGGAVVSVVGLTGVFVDSDLAFLQTGPVALQEANPRLLEFVAHDRAGFGGALISAGAAVTLLSMWGWRRGDSWVWWTLALASFCGFMPALATHGGIGYTDPLHLAPVYAGVAVTVTGLILSWPYLNARPARACVSRKVHTPGYMTSASDNSNQSHDRGQPKHPTDHARALTELRK